MEKIKIKARDKEHLKQIIQNEIKDFGDECDLNHIDISHMKDLSWIFYGSSFNGDISNGMYQT